MNSLKNMSILALVFYLPVLGYGQVSASEEQTIRSTYAKASMATETGALERGPQGILAPSPEQVQAELQSATLHFNISKFLGGEVKEIADKELRDLFTIPATGMILNLSSTAAVSTEQYAKSLVTTRENFATARWKTVDLERLDGYSNMTMAEFLARSARSNVQRYAEVDITATLDGRSVSYSALVLFDASHNAEIFDNVTGFSINSFKDLSVYPHILLETRKRLEPAVQDWLAKHRVAACGKGAESECCNLSTMHCGVTAEDIETATAILRRNGISEPSILPRPLESPGPLPTPGPDPDPDPNPVPPTPTHNFGDVCSDYNTSTPATTHTSSDGTDHVTGSHQFTNSASGSCVYFPGPTWVATHKCGSTAQASVTGSVSENGATYELPLFWHVTGEGDGYGVATSLDGNASATAIAAAAVKNCFLGQCNVSVSGSANGVGVSLPADAIWTQQVPNTVSCGTPITNFLPTFPLPAPCAVSPSLPQCTNPK